MKSALYIAVATIAAHAASSANAQEPPTPGDLGVLADHHIHIRSALDIEAMVALNENVDESLRVENLDENMAVVSAANLIEDLDQAGIKYAAVLSGAYFFGMPEYQASDEEKVEKTRMLNDLVAEQVAQYPDRLRGFCGVNPLSQFAKDEVTRCAETLGMTGVKLHFASSDVDLRNADDLAELRDFFEHVQSLDLPVAVHMRTRNSEFGRVDVMKFVDDVVAHVPGVTFYVAHLSGWGGYDANTHEALTAWAEALETGAVVRPERINFDISATVTRHPKEENAQIAEMVRKLGTGRIYIGSDWPAFNRPRWVAVNFKNQVPLTDEEHADIFDNVAPYFDE